LGPPINRLAGRLPGIHINAAGRAEAASIAERLAAAPPDRVLSSPLERTMETAMIIGNRVGRRVVPDDRLIETEMGPWEGLPVAEAMLAYPDAWQLWRTAPTRVALPGIEPVEAIAGRMEAVASEQLALGGSALLVSHQDPLLTLICRLLELPLDAMRKMEVSPGSMTVFEVAEDHPVLLVLNSTAESPARPRTT
jgi:probable phosphoglycerate mutase